MLVTSQVLDVANLTKLLAAASPLNGAKMGLFINAVTPTPVLTLANFTEPAYTGYVRQAIAWGPVARDDNGNIGSTAGLLSWQMGDALTPTIVHGYFITDTAGTLYYGAELFAVPQNLVDTLSIINTVLEYIQTNGAPGGVTLVA
jgi:hypothetical protein